MTVITLGTVGYGETRPLHTAGRVMTIGIIIIGFTTFVYAVSVLTNLFVSGETLTQMHHRKAKRMSESLEHHVIIVGFGRVGTAVARGLKEMGRQCVVIDCRAASFSSSAIRISVMTSFPRSWNWRITSARTSLEDVRTRRRAPGPLTPGPEGAPEIPTPFPRPTRTKWIPRVSTPDLRG